MDTLEIPDEAVDAAARAMYDLENHGRSALAFALLPAVELRARRDHASVALEAAAPLMLVDARAQALEDAAAVVADGPGEVPGVVAKYLRRRAAGIRG